MALQQRQDFETTKLHGVNEAADPSKLQIGWFTFLQNWIPAQRLKIKKKRGVDDVPTGDFFTPNPCPAPPVVCTDTTLRGQQVITITQAFTQQGGNRRTSWSYINNGEIYTLNGDAGCGSGNMPVTATCVFINHFTTDDGGPPATATPPPIEDPVVPFINTRIGSSDQPAWAAITNAVAGIRIYYNLGATFVDYHVPTSNFGGSNVDAWAIKDNALWTYISCCLDGGPPNVEFAIFDRTTGVKLNDFYSFGNDAVSIANVQLTDNFAYCVGTLAGVKRIYKIDRSTGAIVSSLIVTDLSVQYIAIVDDTLMYLLCSGAPCRIYYLENMTTPIYVGYTADIPVNAFGLGNAMFNNGKIYFGSNGFAGLGVDISKIEISCPDVGILVATVTTGATVVAGNAISVTWSNILVPATSDTILIKPAPPAGTLGLVGATIASFANSSALGSGSTSITIPGGTTPGNYVAMYAALGSIWAATSPVFTVT